MIDIVKIKKLMQARLKDNNGKLIVNIKVDNNFYDVVPLKMDQNGIDTIRSMYGDFFIGHMFLPVIPMDEVSVKNKLNKVVNDGLNDGITIWKIVRVSDSAEVGLIGFTVFGENRDKIEITYASKIGNIIGAICEEAIKLYFDYLNIDSLYGRTLSYNFLSQIILKSTGFEEEGIEMKDDSYCKDDYLTIFKLTKDKYEEIKSNNSGQYKSSRISKKIPSTMLHSKARSLEEAIKSFKDNKRKIKYEYSQELLDYMKKKYPVFFKKY